MPFTPRQTLRAHLYKLLYEAADRLHDNNPALPRKRAAAEQALDLLAELTMLPRELPDSVWRDIARVACDPQRHTYTPATGATIYDVCIVCRSADRYDVRHGGIPVQVFSTDIGG